MHLRWDANQRLIESRLEGVSTRYRYDPLGWRIEKRSGDQITAFAWDGDALVGDWIEDPTDLVVPAKGMAREWVYYPETFEPLALLGGRGGPDTLLHYHNDPNGCPIRLTDSKGEVLWAASYTAWGQLARLHVGYVDNPIRLQGQYEDGETGFYYTRNRYFQPSIGSFLSLDPLGIAPGANLYRFGPNVWAWIDPVGLSCSQMDELAKLRKELGMPITGDRKVDGVLAKFEINGRGFFGINSWASSDALARQQFASAKLLTTGGKVPFGAFANHAEGDVFLQAFKSGEKGGVGRLFVDSDVCGFCQNNLNSMKKAFGLDRLEVIENRGGQLVKTIY